MDAGIFDAGEDRFNLLYNLGQLTTGSGRLRTIPARA